MTHDELIKLYPEFFPENFCFEHCDGWLWIVDDLCNTLRFLLEGHPTCDFKFTQIKEKFGSIRVYFKFETDDVFNHDLIYDAMAKAEEKSSVTCEVCGEPGTHMSPKGWIKVRCDAHKGE